MIFFLLFLLFTSSTVHSEKSSFIKNSKNTENKVLPLHTLYKKLRNNKNLYRKIQDLDATIAAVIEALQQEELQGNKGPNGDKGETGDKGKTGDKGPDGKQGPDGDKGPEGEEGKKGKTGDKGPDGDKGKPGKEVEEKKNAQATISISWIE